MSYLIYLRKSRADYEAEARGEMETLSRHKATLLELSRKQNLEVGAIYEEIVSGDNIASRPQMQKLLQEVSAGMWDGVIVMEIERLARGNTIDQGIVAQAFKQSDTKIITPVKTFDPNNEFDETFFEFNLFMSRQEYKTIKRRMYAGRVASAKEGNFTTSTAPYGYKRVKTENGYTLEVVPEEALVVQQIFQMYINGKGVRVIANELREKGILNCEGYGTVSHILKNPVYKGYVTFGAVKQRKMIDECGKMSFTNVRKFDDTTMFKGKHEAIVSEEDYDKAREIATSRYHPSVNDKKQLRNEYAGIIFCGVCNHSLYLRYFKKSSIFSIACNVKRL